MLLSGWHGQVIKENGLVHLASWCPRCCPPVGCVCVAERHERDTRASVRSEAATVWVAG